MNDRAMYQDVFRLFIARANIVISIINEYGLFFGLGSERILIETLKNKCGEAYCEFISAE